MVLRVENKIRTAFGAAPIRYALNDSGGDASINVVLGVLVAIVFIGIVVAIMNPQIGAWATSITAKVTDLLADGGGS